jgi:hypothetical protein
MGVSFELTDYQDMLRFAKDEKWNAPEDQAIRKKLIEMLKLIKTDGYQAERNILIDAWLAESAKGYALLYQAHQIDYDNLTRYIANDKEDAERIRTYHKVFVAFLSLDQVVPDTEHVLNRKPLPSAKEVENSTREIAILKFDIIGIRKAPVYRQVRRQRLPFEAGLSVLDVLMNVGHLETTRLLDEGVLDSKYEAIHSVG